MTPYSLESDGRAERLNCTMLDCARSMFDAISTASESRNRIYSAGCKRSGVTPFEMLIAVKIELHLYQFGSKAYVNTHKQLKTGKLSNQARLGPMVGYTAGGTY